MFIETYNPWEKREQGEKEKKREQEQGEKEKKGERVKGKKGNGEKGRNETKLMFACQQFYFGRNQKLFCMGVYRNFLTSNNKDKD